jgi:hypothetical protein
MIYDVTYLVEKMWIASLFAEESHPAVPLFDFQKSANRVAGG